MATAEELLRSTIVQPNPEGHIVVGGDRFITVPDNLKRLGVQFDHDMETVVFDCPRKWDDRDMSTMAIYINYALSNGYEDRYPVQNVTVDGDIMHFEWTISRNVTQVAGTVSFLVCVMKADADGNEERHWNSELCTECFISKGMETEESPMDTYPDIVEGLMRRMNDAEEVRVTVDEVTAIRDEANDVNNFTNELLAEAKDESNYIKNSYAPAIKGNVSGEVLRIDDVSPIAHQVQWLVRGKNLANLSVLEGELLPPEQYQVRIHEIYPVSGIINIYAGAGYDGNGHVNTSVKLKELCPQIRVDRQYTLTAASDAWNKCIYLSGLDYFWQFGSTITVVEEMLNCYVGFYGYAPYRGQEDDATCVISGFQIEEGPNATPFTPYVDPTTATVTQHGKNLLRQTGDKSANGVTMKIYEGGLVEVKGTSTDAGVNMHVGKAFMKAGHKYKPTAGLISGDIKLMYWNESIGIQTHPDSDGLLSSSVDTILTVFIYAAGAGVTFNARFKPMLQLVNENVDDTFEPYLEQTIVPATDGSCVTMSNSPTMTIYSDTPGVVIEAEYNRDTTKMFESYVLTDEIITEIADKINNRVLTDVERVEIANMVEEDMADILASLNGYAETLIEGEGDA